MPPSPARGTRASHPRPDPHLRLSRHARERVQQRGYQISDLELILTLGTHVKEGAVLLRKDVKALDRVPRGFRSHLERLAGTAVIIVGDTILSVYRPDREKLRRMLRMSYA